MNAFLHQRQAPTADPAIRLVRVRVGIVFGSEGIEKLLLPAAVVPLLIIRVVAFFTTKLPILPNQGFRPAARGDWTGFALVTGRHFLLRRRAGAGALDRT